MPKNDRNGTHVTKCAFKDCPAYFDPERWREVVGLDHDDDGDKTSGWVLPAGTNLETLPKHEHYFAGQPPKLDRDDHDLHGAWSPESEAAIDATKQYIAKRRELNQAHRVMIGRLYLVPRHEEDALNVELRKLFADSGIRLIGERRTDAIAEQIVRQLFGE